MTEAKHVWPLLKKNLPEVDWQRIENLAGEGVPDVNGCFAGRDIWIENKVFKHNRIVFRPRQPAWITKRTRKGGHVFVLARKEDSLHLFEGHRVWDWALAGNVLADGDISVVPANPMLVLPMPFDYAALRRALFGS